MSANDRIQHKKSRWISVEGISGSGKTHYLRYLRSQLSDHLFVEELSDRKGDGMDQKILAALRASNDDFFQGGTPCAETLLLLSLKAWDYEHYIRPALDRGQTIWEDRGLDTIAIYQSILLHQHNESEWLKGALRILEFAQEFRPNSDLTFLLHDDFERSVQRAEKRRGSAYTDAQRKLLLAAYKLYPELAKIMPNRFVILELQSMNDIDVKKALLESVAD